MNEKNKDKELIDLPDESEGALTVDVYQTPDDIVVESSIAGVEADNIDIDVTSESVTIRGERKREERINESDYFYQECFWGKFARSIILPHEINPDKTTSNIKNGILTIRLPKMQRNKAKKVRVKSE